MIRELAAGIYSFFSGLFSNLFAFLGQLLYGFFHGLVDFLVWLFTPVLQIVAAIFYFLYKLGSLILLVIEMVYRLVFFFVYVMKGLFVTLIGLSYSGKVAALPGRYQEVVDAIQPGLQIAQIDKLATLLLWAIWIFVGVACIKVVAAKG